jgi:hypothetical protein
MFDDDDSTGYSETISSNFKLIKLLLGHDWCQWRASRKRAM